MKRSVSVHLYVSERGVFVVKFNTPRKISDEKGIVMDKVLDVKNVLVIFGGCSPEYGVSLQSAAAVIRNIDRSKYLPVLVGITQEGDWYHYDGDVKEIENDTWWKGDCCTRALVSPDRSRHELVVLDEDGNRYIKIDIALPILHGKNGEDGSVQGYLSAAGIPVAGCKILASALCMDKDRAHRMVGAAGVRVPRAVVVEDINDMEIIDGFADIVGFPLFVKPVKAGSSFGITKVYEKNELCEAVKKAFEYDDSVIVEENIDGFEVGCAVLGTDKLIVGEVDEIELSDGFFDFTEKYTLKTSRIHVPARISAELSDAVKKTAQKIYRTLGCSGFARVDMFLTPDGEIVFNEVNTIPGFTEHSRYPGMMRAAGMEFGEVVDRILEQAALQEKR